MRGGKVELWDAYDKDFQKIAGKTLVRGELIPQGLYHLVCDIIVRHADGAYLLMQRDPRKPWGGMAGETPLECAARELREETGIVATDLTQVGTVIDPEIQRAIYVEFLCVTNWDKEAVTLQEGETGDFRWVSREELLGMKEDQLVTRRMQQFIDELNRP